ncbi:hypothetical protein HHK36_013563 [Tetracentron sinense]|uniref:SHSP domain-containing protein n=1 Tax=Tetracentron sinense TaxID=13715 RepID=A0A834ZAL0_TETSI|nr:hypothetical protein HHK36_013563 [Tetracentron sinense]
MGTVGTALTEEALLNCLKKNCYMHAPPDAGSMGCEDDDVKCSICQEEYVVGDEVGKLSCEHCYHMGDGDNGEEEYKLWFDIPGMTKNDVKVWIEEKMLVVKAKKLPKKDKDGQENLHEEEQTTGRYSSIIALLENVEFEKIKAEVQDGVLYITIPKASNSSKIFDIDVQGLLA